MKEHRRENQLYFGEQFIADCEVRIMWQQKLIERLKRKGHQPTRDAKAVLKGFEASPH